MAAKIYVGNLPFSFTDKELSELFSVYGELSEVSIIKDKQTDRSKGFGFVTFANEDDAKKAISEMNGKEVSGRELKVSEAKPMESRENRPRRPFRRRNFDRF